MNNWFNKLPKKTRIIILITALVVIAGLWYMAWRSAVTTHAPEQKLGAGQAKNSALVTTNVNINVPPDFKRSGTVTFNNPGLKPNTPYFIFEEPGSPALSKELVFDENSICSSGSGTLPCLVMSVSLDAAYGEKRVTAEGASQPDGSLLVTKLSFEK